jgi:hypothetical protein
MNESLFFLNMRNRFLDNPMVIKTEETHVISGFCHKVGEICTLLQRFAVWQFLADTTGQAICPIFQEHKIQDFLKFSALADVTNRMSQNISKELPLYVV